MCLLAWVESAHMFDSSNGLNLPFQELEESFLVLILSYLHDLHCDEPARVHIDSAIDLGNCVSIVAAEVGHSCPQ